MSQFSKEELSFVKEVPEQIEIECPVCLSILTDPHLVTCCGHNFCGSCIERVKASDGSCPMCKEKEYQSFVDKKCLRIINGLEVYCINKKKGCQWKGELKNMSTHLNKEKREGDCQYEEVKCRYEKCQERKQRKHIKFHEDHRCPQRPSNCKYCGSKGTFLSITKDHYEECRQYPVTCPKGCASATMPRYGLKYHINECPLQPVDCVFSWAGCNDKPLRKDVHEHTADTKHMTLLAVACGQLKKDVEILKNENATLKHHVHSVVAHNSYPLLPIIIKAEEAAVHFYTGACGRHMSARIIKGGFFETVMLLAFHEGKFDQYKPKLSKIFAKNEYTDAPLIADTEATYEELPYDVLDTITSTDDPIPPGVINRYIDHFSYTIYAI